MWTAGPRHRGPQSPVPVHSVGSLIEVAATHKTAMTSFSRTNIAGDEEWRTNLLYFDGTCKSGWGLTTVLSTSSFAHL